MTTATKLPPGARAPRPVQTIGWITRTGPFLERCRARYGDVFSVRIAQEGTWVMLANPEHVRQVFTGDPKVFHAGEANAILRPVLGHNSVLLLDEQQHLAQRKLLLPPFHGERMQRYGELMREVAEQEIARWPQNEPLQLWAHMQAVTLEVIMRAVFGMDEGTRLVRLREAIRQALEWATAPAQMAALALLGPARVEKLPMFQDKFRDVDALLYEEIRTRRGADDLADRDDIMSLLLQATHEDGSPMSDVELRDELMTLLVAGHETTANSLAWAFERLARTPGGLERVAGDDAYAEAAVRETLRLRPVIAVVARGLTRAAEIGGRVLPAGTVVTPCILLVHRRPDVYPDPDAFRPERFLDRAPGTYTWIPFGGGVRRCIGATFAQMEMQVVLRRIAERVALEPVGDPEPIRRRAIALVPARGGEVRVVGPRAAAG